MNARHKLNSANVQGAFIVAAIAGYGFGSWVVFFAVLALLVGGALHSGEIRPSGGNKRRR